MEIDGERVIGFERDRYGYDKLNLLIRNEKMEPILVMENNFWTVYRKNIFDLRCSAKGRILEIISNDGITKLSMRFDDYSQENFPKYLLKIASNENIKRLLISMGNPKTIPVWKIRGDLKWGSSYIRIGDLFVEDLIRHKLFFAVFVVNSRSAFGFKDGSITIG